MSHLPCSVDPEILFKREPILDTSGLLTSIRVADAIIFHGPLRDRLLDAFTQHKKSDWSTVVARCTTGSKLDSPMYNDVIQYWETLSPGLGTEYRDPTSVQLVEYKSSPVYGIAKIGGREYPVPLKRLDIEVPPSFVYDDQTDGTWDELYEELDRARNNRSDAGSASSTFYLVTNGQEKGPFTILCSTEGLMERLICDAYVVRNLQDLQDCIEPAKAFEIVTIDLNTWSPGTTLTGTSE